MLWMLKYATPPPGLRHSLPSTPPPGLVAEGSQLCLATGTGLGKGVALPRLHEQPVSNAWLIQESKNLAYLSQLWTSLKGHPSLRAPWGIS